MRTPLVRGAAQQGQVNGGKYSRAVAAPQVAPSDLQAKAIREIKDWFRCRTSTQQVFRLFGFAGSGKTTITRLAIAELGLDDDDVLFGAYTGKASLVMRRAGTPATTIHSMIYLVSEASPAEIERVYRASVFASGICASRGSSSTTSPRWSTPS